MAQNFIACDRDRELLLPPSLRDWLPEGRLAWFVIDAVGQLDLSPFDGAYRADGHGRAAHDPAMIVALLLYGYALGERSSRRLERRCVEDVATRVICATRRRITRQSRASVSVTRRRWPCCSAMSSHSAPRRVWFRVGVIAVDGTKGAANAAPQATRDYEQIAREILAEAGEVDAEEDEQFGYARGDELPSELATAQGPARLAARCQVPS